MERAPIDERLDALTQSVELLADSTRDLRAVVEASLAREREAAEAAKAHREADMRFMDLIGDVLKRWGQGEQM